MAPIIHVCNPLGIHREAVAFARRRLQGVADHLKNIGSSEPAVEVS
jgi:hypothetical protein